MWKAQRISPGWRAIAPAMPGSTAPPTPLPARARSTITRGRARPHGPVGHRGRGRRRSLDGRVRELCAVAAGVVTLPGARARGHEGRRRHRTGARRAAGDAGAGGARGRVGCGRRDAAEIARRCHTRHAARGGGSRATADRASDAGCNRWRAAAAARSTRCHGPPAADRRADPRPRGQRGHAHAAIRVRAHARDAAPRDARTSSRRPGICRTSSARPRSMPR